MKCEHDRKLKVNSIKCLACGDVIVSRHRHDFVTCACGKVFTDGGNDYQRFGWEPTLDDPSGGYGKCLEVLSVYEECDKDECTIAGETSGTDDVGEASCGDEQAS